MDTERERVQRKILAFRRLIDTYLAYGNVEDAMRVRNDIANLERQLQQQQKGQRQ